MPGVLFLADLGYDHRIWAGLAVHAALDGQAAGLVLFQPAPDDMPPEARPDAETDLVWLEDRAGARAAITDLLRLVA